MWEWEHVGGLVLSQMANLRGILILQQSPMGGSLAFLDAGAGMLCEFDDEVELGLEKSGHLRRGRPVNCAAILGISSEYFGAATEAEAEHFDPPTHFTESVFKLLRLRIVLVSTRTAVDPVFQGVCLCYARPKSQSDITGYHLEGASGVVRLAGLRPEMKLLEGRVVPLLTDSSKLE